MNDIDFSTFGVVPRLPVFFDNSRGENIPADLTGATIVNIGTLPVDQAVEGGGLVIDYRRKGGQIKRLILAFNELAMWVVYKGPSNATTSGVNQ